MSETDPLTSVTPASDVIASGVSQGLNRSRVRLNDRRMLVIYLVLALCLAFFSYRFGVLASAVHKNCITTNVSNNKANGVLDQLTTNVKNSTSLTPDQKQQALKSYSNLHFSISDCSKLSWY